MENASKALLMAGAILIAIILISFGVILLKNSNGIVKTGKEGTDLVATRTSNGTFEKYLGKRKGSEINNLLIDVRTFNANKPAGEQVKVSYNGGAETTNVSSIQDSISPNKKYRVKIEDTDYYANGLVKTVRITPL